MQELTIQEQKTIIKKWVIQILSMLYNEQEFNYTNIKNNLKIPNTTLSIRLRQLVEIKYLEKFIYGSIRKPHNTTYKITDLGLEYINSIIPY